MKSDRGFAVIYRWELRPGMEDSFREAWLRITEALAKERGALGSCLHHVEDDKWLAYARWPSRDAWERSNHLGSIHVAASEQMHAAIAVSEDPVLLDIDTDRLKR